MKPATIERRFAPVAIRAAGDGQTLFGRAVEYGQWSELLFETFREQIAPGAFDDSLRSGRDVYCSVDHDMDRVLGRLSSGTLRLMPDERGIGVECSIGAYSYAKDLIVAIERKDLRGMSFIFDVLDDQWETRDGIPHRTVTKADIYEVAFVFFPAYSQTSAGVRASFPIEGEKRAIDKALSMTGWRQEAESRQRTLDLLAQF